MALTLASCHLLGDADQMRAGKCGGRSGSGNGSLTGAYPCRQFNLGYDRKVASRSLIVTEEEKSKALGII
jgi:hypothetical protein